MRYIFETNVDNEEEVNMVEECAVNDEKTITTCTKVTKDGKKIVETTDVKELIRKE